LQNREADANACTHGARHRPRNATAQGALLDLLGNTDSQATESRLKTLIEREPSPQLYQTWAPLRQPGTLERCPGRYFDAYRGAPDNADYASTCAVSLDQLHQTQAALSYYEKALRLRTHRFDRAQGPRG